MQKFGTALYNNTLHPTYGIEKPNPIQFPTVSLHQLDPLTSEMLEEVPELGIGRLINKNETSNVEKIRSVIYLTAFVTSAAWLVFRTDLTACAMTASLGAAF